MCHQLQICTFLNTSHICFCSAVLGCVKREFYVVTTGPPLFFFFHPNFSLGTLQNLRPDAVHLQVSQELQGDQNLVWEGLRSTVDLQTSALKYSLTRAWLQIEENPHNTRSPYKGCSHSQSYCNVKCFHAECWKIWGFRYPSVYMADFLWNLDWRLLHQCCFFWPAVTGLLWSSECCISLNVCCSLEQILSKLKCLHWYFRHRGKDSVIVFSTMRSE